MAYKTSTNKGNHISREQFDEFTSNFLNLFALRRIRVKDYPFRTPIRRIFDESDKIRSSPGALRIGGHLKLVQSAITLAARGVLPVWKTTPIATLLRDAGLPSAEVALEEARARFAFRAQTVDAGHPLASRVTINASTRANARARTTRLQRSAALIPEAPRPILRPPHYSVGSRLDPILGMKKEEAALAFKAWEASLPKSDVLIFSDGSE